LYSRVFHGGDVKQHAPGAPHRTLCTAAYQSLVFNHAASRRAQLYGLSAVTPGDLVEVTDQSTGQATVRHATPDDVAAGTLTIHDVVLPLPGMAKGAALVRLRPGHSLHEDITTLTCQPCNPGPE
jgi:hypothetical protein